MNIEYRRLTIDCITKRLETNCQSIQTDGLLTFKGKDISFITCVQEAISGNSRLCLPFGNQTSTHSFLMTTKLVATTTFFNHATLL